MEIFQISGTTPSDSSQNFGPENTKIGNWYFQKLFTVYWGNVTKLPWGLSRSAARDIFCLNAGYLTQ